MTDTLTCGAPRFRRIVTTAPSVGDEDHLATAFAPYTSCLLIVTKEWHVLDMLAHDVASEARVDSPAVHAGRREWPADSVDDN